MREVIAILMSSAWIVALWGIIRPFKGLSRRQFSFLSIVFFAAFVIAVPPESPEEQALRAERVTKEAAAPKVDQDRIVAKARHALDKSIVYSKEETPETFKDLGPDIFDRINDILPGAIFSAAESNSCAEVIHASINRNLSEEGLPIWEVLCSNENRFVVNLPEAEAALQRYKTQKLTASDLKPDCTTETPRDCRTRELKEANRGEVITFCDMMVQEVLISDADFAWSTDYNIENGNIISVAKDFKASNQYGAVLRHRYLCEFNAVTKRIVGLRIKTPLGVDRII